MKPISLCHSRKGRIFIVLFSILILLTTLCLYRACVQPIAGGVTIAGVDIGGIAPTQARRLLKKALEETICSQTLILQLPEETISLSPEECGVKVSIGKALFAARHAGPSEALSLKPWLKMDSETIFGKLNAYAAQYDTVLTQTVWQLEGDAPSLSTDQFSPEVSGQTLVLTMGTPELHINCDAILSEIFHTVSNGIALCRENQYQISPMVIPSKLPEAVSAADIAKEYHAVPVNDTVSRDTYELIPGSYGTHVDEDLLANRIRQAEYGETIRLPLQYIPPDIWGEETYFQDVLGACETRHTDNKNRNVNLQLQCDALNGLVLQPGEMFSMNEVLGERTTERGYLPAPAYSGNRLVNSPGGGVCQGTTTLYNCVLLADLEVVTRFCHGVRVGYVPLGLDAAVNYLTTDFQFRNNWNLPIQLKAWLEDGYVKMQILGTDEKDYYIKMETGTGEDDYAYYARSYKCKYSKETDELLSRDVEAFSTYYKSYE